MNNDVYILGVLIALNSVALVGAVLVIHGALRRVSASFRYMILAGAFVGLIILPVLAVMVPTWNLPIASRTVLNSPRFMQGVGGLGTKLLDARIIVRNLSCGTPNSAMFTIRAVT